MGTPSGTANTHLLTTRFKGLAFHQQIRQTRFGRGKSVKVTQIGIDRSHLKARVENHDQDSDLGFSGWLGASAQKDRQGSARSHTADREDHVLAPGEILHRYFLHNFSQWSARWFRAGQGPVRPLFQSLTGAKDSLRRRVTSQDLPGCAAHDQSNIKDRERIESNFKHTS